MQKLNAHEKKTLIVFSILIFAAFELRSCGMHGFHPILTGWLRGILQCSMIIAWGISIRQRVLQGSIRKYLIAIAVLLLFWLSLRTIKYMLLHDFDTPARYCWYMYYIPMQLIPLLALLAAICQGRPENYRLPAKYNLLYIPAISAIVTVMTNDLHQKVFSFPGGIPDRGDEYSYGFMYPLVMMCLGIEVLLFFLILFRKSRLPWKGRRLIMPFIPITIGIIYGIVYIVDSQIVKTFAGDMNAVFVMVIVLTCEACISTGLIPSNTRYVELFSASSIHACITDEDYNIIISSEKESYARMPAYKMRETEAVPVMLSDSIRLSGASITGGHILWTEDVSELTKVLRELVAKNELLENSNILLEKNFRTTQNIRRLEEQNRLYDAMAEQTASQIAYSSRLLEQFRREKSEEKRRRLLGKLVVIGAYLKRRNNLIFIKEQSRWVSERELELCLSESFDNLRLYGADCSYYINIGKDIPADMAMMIYDFFEEAVEVALDSLHSMLLRIFIKKNMVYCCVDVDTDADLSGLAKNLVTDEKSDIKARAMAKVTYSRDDAVSSLILSIPKGGTKGEDVQI